MALRVVESLQNGLDRALTQCIELLGGGRAGKVSGTAARDDHRAPVA